MSDCKFLSSVKLGGHTIGIYSKHLAEDFGQFVPLENRIYIAEEYTTDRSMFLTIVLHELIEAVNAMYELDLTHQNIQTLEMGLFQMLKPHLNAESLGLQERIVDRQLELPLGG